MPPPLSLRDLTLVQAQPNLVIRSGASAMPAISPTLNDGVVNTVRQIVNPRRPEEVGGFVVADHADVLGHYDRQDALIGGKSYNAGLFHSGAGFGDDEFFELYRRVAEAMLRTIPHAGRGAVAPRASRRTTPLIAAPLPDGGASPAASENGAPTGPS